MRFTMGHRDSFMLADDISTLLGSQTSLDGGAHVTLPHPSKSCCLAFRMIENDCALLLATRGCRRCKRGTACTVLVTKEVSGCCGNGVQPKRMRSSRPTLGLTGLCMLHGRRGAL